MRRFEFPLDRVLTLKRQLEKAAEQEQLRARQAADQARAAVADLAAELDRVAAHLGGAVGRAVPPGQWAAAAELSDRIGQALRAAEAAAAEAEATHEAAARERARLATEVEALATLRQDRLDLWKRDEGRADRERLDEVSLRRWEAAGR